jgi:phosphatidylinositol kinase/protein kinase (PI-3  family)
VHVRQELVLQVELVDLLMDIGQRIKCTKGTTDDRTALLRQLLTEHKERLERPCRLPLDPRFVCCGFTIDRCRVLGSKTVPLLLAFKNSDPKQPSRMVIFKIGDDLHQDVLTLQVMRIFDSVRQCCGDASDHACTHAQYLTGLVVVDLEIARIGSETQDLSSALYW